MWLTRLEPLGERLGPVSIQVPASFGPESLDVLDQFASTLSSRWRWSVGMRHPAFFEPGEARRAVLDLTRRHHLDWIILDSRSFFAGPVMTKEEEEAFHRKPQLPVRPVATGPHPIVRFIGQNEAEANPPFWEKWLPKITEWLGEDASRSSSSTPPTTSKDRALPAASTVMLPPWSRTSSRYPKRRPRACSAESDDRARRDTEVAAKEFELDLEALATVNRRTGPTELVTFTRKAHELDVTVEPAKRYEQLFCLRDGAAEVIFGVHDQQRCMDVAHEANRRDSQVFLGVVDMADADLSAEGGSDVAVPFLR